MKNTKRVDEDEDDDENKAPGETQLMQVSISFMRIGWMLDENDYEFLRGIIDTGEIDLFTNKNVQSVITFIWSRTWNYFYWH